MLLGGENSGIFNCMGNFVWEEDPVDTGEE